MRLSLLGHLVTLGIGVLTALGMWLALGGHLDISWAFIGPALAAGFALNAVSHRPNRFTRSR